MYYTVIKHDGHLRTRGKCRKHDFQATDFFYFKLFLQLSMNNEQSCKTGVFKLNLRFFQHFAEIISVKYINLYEVAFV